MADEQVLQVLLTQEQQVVAGNCWQFLAGICQHETMKFTVASCGKSWSTNIVTALPPAVGPWHLGRCSSLRMCACVPVLCVVCMCMWTFSVHDHNFNLFDKIKKHVFLQWMLSLTYEIWFIYIKISIWMCVIYLLLINFLMQNYDL